MPYRHIKEYNLRIKVKTSLVIRVLRWKLSIKLGLKKTGGQMDVEL